LVAAVEVVGFSFASLGSEGFFGSAGSWDIAVVTQDAVNMNERIETLTHESKLIRQLIVQQPLALIVVGNHGLGGSSHCHS
jgi:hypothetical protein